ncbi:MAG: NAD(P)H-hydrate dehydratase [Clostridia bacterium]
MLQTITPSEMRRVEQRAMRETELSSETLMTRAAAQVARAAARVSQGRAGVTVCLCGTGNNGGDGLSAMRILAKGDASFLGECRVLEGALSPDAQRELERLGQEAPQVTVLRLQGERPPKLPARIACVLDALFGTGLSRPLEGMAAALCAQVNQLRGVPVIAVDIPSGLHGETGEALGCAVRATETIAFHRPKLGLYLRQGPNFTGRLRVADIGLPPALDDASGLSVLEESDLAALLPARERVSHKGSYGQALLWVGSPGMAGAAAISATAALRTGAGLVTVACPDRVMDAVQVLCPCATCLPLPQTNADALWAALQTGLARANAVGVGCGLGRSPLHAEVLARLLTLLERDGLPAVLDADALSLLAAFPSGSVHASTTVLTPHPGEAARLLHCSVESVTRDALGAARALHERFGAAVVLKGAVSVLCTRDGVGLNPFGTPAMAKGGSGDALTGVLCALLAGRHAGVYAHLNDLELLQVGCALHALAGEEAARRHGERGMLATDLCACLGLVPRELSAQSESHIHAEAAAPLPGTFPPDASACEALTPAAHLPPESPLGKRVTVTVDRRLGTRHPEHKDILYLLNYGYVQDVLANDNAWQDAYVYGETTPLECFEGEVIAVIHRLNDAEDKWVVAKPGTRASEQELRKATAFQEQFFEIAVECL